MPFPPNPFKKSDREKYGIHGGSSIVTLLRGTTEISDLGPWALWDTFAGAKIDAPGNILHAYSESGGAVNITAEVDIGALLAWFVTINLKGGMRVQRCSTVFVAATRFHDATPNIYIDRPKVLVMMTGHSTAVKLTLGVEVGLKVSLAGALGESGNKNVSRKLEGEKVDKTLNTLESTSESTGEILESFALKAEVKLVGSLTGSIEGAWFHASCPAPINYADTDTRIKDHFEALLGPPPKRDLKDEMTTFLNGTGVQGIKAPSFGTFDLRMPGAKPKLVLFKQQLELLKQHYEAEQLLLGLSVPETEKLAKTNYYLNFIAKLQNKEAQSTAQSVQSTASSEMTSSNLSINDSYHHKMCFLQAASFSPSGTVGAELKAEVSIAAQGVEGGISGSVTRQMKWSGYRFQTFVHAKQVMRARQRGRVNEIKNIRILTQDCNIFYKLTSLRRNAGGSVNVLGMRRSREIESVKVNRDILNSLTYKSQTLVWDYPSISATDIELQPGSSFSYGESVTVGKLWSLGQQVLDQKNTNNSQTIALATSYEEIDDKYARKLASALNIPYATLMKFLCDWYESASSGGTTTAPPQAESEAILIESIFAVEGAPTLESYFEWDDGLCRVQAKPTFHPASAGDLPLMGYSNNTLARIMLRRRVYDNLDNSSVKFTLGAKANFAADLKIELEEIEKAGHMMLEDIYDYVVTPAKSVTPTMLFHQ